MDAQQLLSKMKIMSKARTEILAEDDGLIDAIYIAEVRAERNLLNELIADLEEST